jgi:hypothetical protein
MPAGDNFGDSPLNFQLMLGITMPDIIMLRATEVIE